MRNIDWFSCSRTRTSLGVVDDDLRVRVVVREDPAVTEAVTRVALCAPLAHPDAVTPPSAVEQEHRATVREPWERKDGKCHQPDPHPGSAE